MPQNALRLLETRRRKARPKNVPGVEGMPLTGISSTHAAPTFCGTPSLLGMSQWLQLLGHSVYASEVSRLRAFANELSD